MEEIKILLVEDHAIVRQGLRAILSKESDIKIIGEAKDGFEAVQLAGELKPDIIIMDISMPGLSGLEATHKIQKKFPDIRVIILTMHKNEELILQVMAEGAFGFITKDSVAVELILAIHSVYKGGFFLSAEISKKVVKSYIKTATKDQTSIYNIISEREMEVLRLLAEGHPTREIAEMLFISVKKVGKHKANLMAKLNLKTNADLIKYAIRKGIIDSNVKPQLEMEFT